MFSVEDCEERVFNPQAALSHRPDLDLRYWSTWPPKGQMITLVINIGFFAVILFLGVLAVLVSILGLIGVLGKQADDAASGIPFLLFMGLLLFFISTVVSPIIRGQIHVGSDWLLLVGVSRSGLVFRNTEKIQFRDILSIAVDEDSGIIEIVRGHSQGSTPVSITFMDERMRHSLFKSLGERGIVLKHKAERGR